MWVRRASMSRAAEIRAGAAGRDAARQDALDAGVAELGAVRRRRLEHAVGHEQQAIAGQGAHPRPRIGRTEAGAERQIRRARADGFGDHEPLPPAALAVAAGAIDPAGRMAGVADGEQLLPRPIRDQRGRRDRLEAALLEAHVQRLHHLALVPPVDAGPQLGVHHARDAGDALAVAGDVGEAHAGDDPGVAHRAVVDVAARRAVAGIASRGRRRGRADLRPSRRVRCLPELRRK